MTVTTEGIVLRKKPLKDHEQVLTLFTPDLGKLLVVVKKSTFDLFSVLNVVLRPGKTYWQAYEATLLSATSTSVRSSYSHFEAGTEMLTTIDSLTLVQQENQELYHVLRKYLSLLDSSKPDNIENVLTGFYQAVVHAEGLSDQKPDVQSCRVIIQGYIGADRDRRKS